MSPSPKRRNLMAAIVTLAALHVPVPAFAGGSVTVSIAPQGEAAEIIRQGLQIYSIVQQQKTKKKNHARIDQKGRGNAAALSQKGGNNYGLIHQRGRDHTATVAQEGWNNGFGVFQFGRNTNIDVAQIGRGKVGLVLQSGW